MQKDSSNFKPSKAYNKPFDLNSLKYPVLASPKLDGVRCLIKNGKALTMSMKEIPNDFIRNKLSLDFLNGFDGELIVGDPRSKTLYRDTLSAVMSKDGEPNFTYYVFDTSESELCFNERLRKIILAIDDPNVPAKHFRIMWHQKLYSADQLRVMYNECLSLGYEGLIIRYPDAKYKNGRATFNDGFFKLKPIMDVEATVVCFEEAVYNDNEVVLGNDGVKRRRSKKDCKTRGKGLLGAIIAKSPLWSECFRVGSFQGLTKEEKESLWNERDKYVGKIFKMSHMTVGGKNKPRHPVFIGWRSELDMDNTEGEGNE